MDNRTWRATLYRYQDGLPHDPDRYEIFVPGDKGPVSVGGVMLVYGPQASFVAFICTLREQRRIRTPQDVKRVTGGLCVYGQTRAEALQKLKLTYPFPEEILQAQDAAF